MRNLNYKQNRLLEFMNDIYGGNLADKRLLDAGGMDGLVMSNLPESLLKVNLEIERKYLQEAEQEKIWGDVRWLPFRDRSFDICIFSEVLEHIYFPEKAVAEVTRVTDEVIFTSPNNSLIRKLVILPGLIIRKGLSPVFSKYRSIDIAQTLRGSFVGISPAMSHTRTYSWKEVKDFFANEGFELKRFEAIGSFLSKPKLLGDLKLERLSPKLAGKMMMWFVRGREE